MCSIRPEGRKELNLTVRRFHNISLPDCKTISSFLLTKSMMLSTLGGETTSAILREGLGGRGGRLLGVPGCRRVGDAWAVEGVMEEMGFFNMMDTSRASSAGVASRTGPGSFRRRAAIKGARLGGGEFGFSSEDSAAASWLRRGVTRGIKG
jgi:hypothetical protein